MTAFIPKLAGLSEIIGQYDAIISDVWGVLHNGIVATPGAKDALASARGHGKTVALLTNAPRPPASIAKQLAQLGITAQSYDAIISSGGETRSLMQAEGDTPFYHLGPQRDHALFEGLAARPVRFEDAKYLLVTGLFDDETEQAEDYRPQLEAAFARKLKLYCANPDLIVERGDKLIPCAGAIAELYETIGGEVIWVGKPRPHVYAMAHARINTLRGAVVPKSRILCIGDALRTDLAGARDNGYPVLMTLAGIHAHQIGLHNNQYDETLLTQMLKAADLRPLGCMVTLDW